MEEVPAKLTVKRWAEYISKKTGSAVSPQLVHYYLRTNAEFQDAATECDCGTRVLMVELAEKIWMEIRK